MKSIAGAALLTLALVSLRAGAQEVPEESSTLNDPAASVQIMVEASIAGRPVHVGTPVRASTRWFPRDSACHVYCPQGMVLISTVYEDPSGAGDCQPNDLMLCAPLSIR
ncbi:MAG: hypothetical protein K0S81_3169 [Rhodospirillales bacterium]|jgi:hypothetical protein|nr:hypothetical protein [Rhodospirillales bacterium]